MNLFTFTQKIKLEMLKVSFGNLCRVTIAPDFFLIFFLLFFVKQASKDFSCLPWYAGRFSSEKSELEKEGYNCYADEFCVSCLKEKCFGSCR